MTLTLERPVDAARPGVWQVYQWELEKLSAQVRTRLAGALCLIGPLVFAVGLQLSSTLPADTLFGRWVGDSGFAIPLVVLGFAGSWGFPLVACLVAGDIFSTEDHHRTWTLILTRSVSRRDLFLGKVLATASYVGCAMTLLCLSSLASGLLLVGHRPLVGLSGNPVSAWHAVALVLSSWLVAAPSVLGFAALGILVSVLTRNGLAGVIVPTVVGLVLDLLLLVSGIGPVRELLPNAGFVAWHGLWTSPSYRQPIGWAVLSSLVCGAACLGISWRVFRRRDVTVA